MRSTSAFILVISLSVAIAETYSEEHDDFDIEKLVANIPEFQKFVGCFLGTNPCSDEASDFKEDLPDVFETACIKCTDAQKHLTAVFLDGLESKLPEESKDFMNKYDPEGKYLDPLKNAIANS